ncbi:MAG: translation initiation factor IF-2 [Alphaproteobacteria bacterium]|jgi:translation initiation factor IF-2|nr:translation initiation factor IF-2 [Alphaproteobacteria bacterium]MBS6989076.1 translation initiation factor IF-2 [Azospirillum sp.]
MTQDNANNKLTLSGKSTLTLKNIGDASRSHSHDGKKFVQVEVRKKRIINPAAVAEPKVEIDEVTAQKLKLIAEAKEHEARRRQEEEEREKERARQRELEEQERLKREQEEAERKAAEASAPVKPERKEEPAAEDKFKVKKSKDYDDDEEDDEDDYHSKKFKKPVVAEKSLSREEAFEQERKKIMKRSFEPQRRGGKVNLHSIGSVDDDDDDYGFGGPRRRFKKKQPKPVQPQQPQEKIIKDVVVPEIITVQELANRMAEKGADVIKKLMALGVMATINQPIDGDTAQIVVEEMGHRVKRVSDSDVELGLKGEEDRPEEMQPRAPVVTVMGHVDHGKTSLLDALRETNVASHEAGGITQHIGAYQITVKTGDKITFIDTPGHEAFSEMRARGAKVTDIVVLVVAANDGIMPQTVEAIRHAQAAEVPIVVAINKIDLPGADPMKVKTALLQHGIAVEELGGESLCAEVSAKKRINIDKLVEAILLQAEILDLKANPNRKAEGAVIEAKMEKGRGSVATVLVQKGTLHIGDIVIAGKEWGRVRAMFNEMGKKMNEAGPAAPVEVLGLQGTPAAGDDFIVVADENQAKEVTGYRIRKERDAKLVKSAKSAMEQMLDKIKSGEVKHLPVIIKADVQGSIEAIEGTITKLSNDEVSVQILHSAVGPISDSDVTLAKASNAFIIGFNVRAIPHARDMARQDGVDIRYYSIIYDVADDIKKALEGMLSPELKEKILGYAEIRNVFNITGVGKVAGCMITEGMVKRGAKVRLLRDNVVIHDGSLGQLKRFKDDVKEVKEGYECGMSFENYNDIQVGDFIECYEIESIAAKL